MYQRILAVVTVVLVGAAVMAGGNQSNAVGEPVDAVQMETDGMWNFTVAADVAQESFTEPAGVQPTLSGVFPEIIDGVPQIDSDFAADTVQCTEGSQDAANGVILSERNLPGYPCGQTVTDGPSAGRGDLVVGQGNLILDVAELGDNLHLRADTPFYNAKWFQVSDGLTWLTSTTPSGANYGVVEGAGKWVELDEPVDTFSNRTCDGYVIIPTNIFMHDGANNGGFRLEWADSAGDWHPVTASQQSTTAGFSPTVCGPVSGTAWEFWTFNSWPEQRVVEPDDDNQADIATIFTSTSSGLTTPWSTIPDNLPWLDINGSGLEYNVCLALPVGSDPTQVVNEGVSLPCLLQNAGSSLTYGEEVVEPGRAIADIDTTADPTPVVGQNDVLDGNDRGDYVIARTIVPIPADWTTVHLRASTAPYYNSVHLYAGEVGDPQYLGGGVGGSGNVFSGSIDVGDVTGGTCNLSYLEIVAYLHDARVKSALSIEWSGDAAAWEPVTDRAFADDYPEFEPDTPGWIDGTSERWCVTPTTTLPPTTTAPPTSTTTTSMVPIPLPQSGVQYTQGQVTPSPTIPSGGSVQISDSGFEPGETVGAFVQDDEQTSQIGSAVATDDGDVTMDVHIPSEVCGEAELFTWSAMSGTDRGQNITVTGCELPATGRPHQVEVALLAIVGGLFLLGARRRSSSFA